MVESSINNFMRTDKEVIAEKEKCEILIEENKSYMRQYIKEEDWYSIIRTTRELELLEAQVTALNWVLDSTLVD